MDQSDNPYAAPPITGSLVMDELSTAATGDVAAAERVRRELISHETKVKSVRWLYWLGGVIGLLTSLPIIYTWVVDLRRGAEIDLGPMIVVLLVCGAVIGVTILMFVGANWLGKLDRRAKIAVGVVSGLGLFQVPLGTLINGYILHLVFSTKGQRVFSDEYKEIIRLTPHVKSRTSTLAWVILAVVILAFVASIWFVSIG